MNKLELPPDLTKAERSLMHFIVKRELYPYGLRSKSMGSGDQRRLVIDKFYKTKTTQKSTGMDNKSSKDNKSTKSNINKIQESSRERLELGRMGDDILKRYMGVYPPSDEEIDMIMGVDVGEGKGSGNANVNGKGDNTSNSNSKGQQQKQQKENKWNLVGKFTDYINENEIDNGRHSHPHPQPHRKPPDINLAKRKALHEKLQSIKHAHPPYANMQKARRKLPAHQYQDMIVNTIRDNRVTILSGETGCGKSTQVPQFILDDDDDDCIKMDMDMGMDMEMKMEMGMGPGCKMAITQPRRISAISLADRVASERCEPVGKQQQGQGSQYQYQQGAVGYNVRMDSSTCAATQMLFLTPGVLLKKFHSDPTLSEFTHIIIDEIHERDKHTEFLMIVLKELVKKRKDLRVVLMSATLQSEALSHYWSIVGEEEGGNDGNGTNRKLLSGNVLDDDKENNSNNDLIKPAIISIPGRTFPVSTYYLEDILRTTGAFGVDESDDESNENDDDMMDMYDNALMSEDEADEYFKIRGGGINDNIDAIDGNINANGLINYQKEMLNRYHSMHDSEQIDNELIVETMKHIDSGRIAGDGAILVFLPGWREISDVMRLLENTYPFNDPRKFLVLPLHSGLPSNEQKLVFKRPPKGVRKVLLSTNIAETSVTFDDVGFVIDSGRAKEKNYDPHLQTSTLQSVWISQASAKQRRGRAGRTRPGSCFHLFSRDQHDTKFRPYLESELLRTSLEEICLQCKTLGLAKGGPGDSDGIPSFLGAALSPPHEKSVTNALDALIALGAMDEDTNLTRLGHCLSHLSVDPRLGKMIVWGYILGCAKDAVAMAVGMSYKSPFILPPPAMRSEAEEAKLDISGDTESDHVTMLKVLKVLDGYRKEGREYEFYNYCSSNFINAATIKMVSDLRQNIARELIAIGYKDPNDMNDWHNRNSNSDSSRENSNLEFLQSAIVAGVFPNVASNQERARNFGTSMNKMCTIHRSSVNGTFKQPLSSKRGQLHQHVAYGEMMKGEGADYTINQTTRLSSVLPILLLCGDLSIRPASLPGLESASLSSSSDNINTNKNGDASEASYNAAMAVNGWISVHCDNLTASALALLRNRLDLTFHRITSNPHRGFDDLLKMETDTLRVLDVVTKSSFDHSNN
uniref:RNA helicase n=1 Tax=Chaetoceros debilis TaxID=122233 RepID=A0A7S3VCU7_9STRA